MLISNCRIIIVVELWPVEDLEGAEPAPPPSPLGDGLMPSLMVM